MAVSPYIVGFFTQLYHTVVQVSLVQICARLDGTLCIWLLHLARLDRYRVPAPLEALLMDKDILKGGRNVGGDLQRLCRLNGLRGYEGAFELGKNARLRGLVTDGYAALSIDVYIYLCVANG
jgi:hypothetical protein